MPTRSLFEIDVARTDKKSRNATQHLHAQLRKAIADGRLLPGARLPPTRDAQARFGVSRNTLAEVYARLLNEGLAIARHGSGTFVAAADARPEAAGKRRAPNYRLNAFWARPDVTRAIGFWHDGAAPATGAPGAAPIDFRPALIDSRLFPMDVFRRMVAKELRALERRPARYRSPQGNQGNYRLRAAITRHISLTRAVVANADEVLVTAGAQQAFDLLARVLVVPGATIVAVEDPGYPPMRVAFAAAGATLAPVGVDAQGLVVEQIPPGTNVICLCPSHQFPLGITMSPQRRRELVEFARRTDAVIVEDDYDGEFRFDGSPLTALHTPEANDHVFYVGTFSKCMLPAIRLGFVIAPGWAMPALVAAKNGLDWHCPTPMQLGLAAFLEEGHLSRHVRRMRQIYGQRRRHLVEQVRQQLGGLLEPIVSPYGMHVGAIADAPLPLAAAAGILRERGIELHTLERYYLGPQTRQGVVFGYGAVSPAQIRAGVSALRTVLAELGT